MDKKYEKPSHIAKNNYVYANFEGIKDTENLQVAWEVKIKPHKAAITLHIVICAIGNGDAALENIITPLMRIRKAAFDF